MPLTFAETPLYYKDSQGQYHRVLSGADMTGYAKIDEESHRNMLDNWYFAGGGSQLGAGVFPINQRGQSSYSVAGYGIDRWSCATSSVTVLCGYSNYIVLKSSTAGAQNLLIQYIDNKELLAGKTVTISAMINSRLVQSTISIPADSSTWGSTIGSGSDSVGGCAVYLRYLNSKLCFVFYASSTYTANTNILIKAAKLELGPYQTLAHNEGTEENPNWVLNEIPTYSEELNKCLMYFERLKGPYVGFATGYSTNGSNAYVCGKVNPKVKAPTITLSGTICLQSVNHAGSDSSASTSITTVYALPSGNFSFICQSSNMTQGEFNQAQFRDTTSYLDFSAEQ